MNVQPFTMNQDAALAALRQYKAHRNTYDDRDWEIERIYRQIAKGKVVISALDAIVKAGLDDKGRPKLAIGRADAVRVECHKRSNRHTSFRSDNAARWVIQVPLDMTISKEWFLRALTPRIPPQHRPETKHLNNYWLLWEADWTAIPVDPYLLKRIGRDAWVVLAAWELTQIELSVLRA